MPADVALEVAHVLFMDVVGYSKLLINDRTEVLDQLKRVVRQTRSFQEAETAGKLIRLATGDGMTGWHTAIVRGLILLRLFAWIATCLLMSTRPPGTESP